MFGIHSWFDLRLKTFGWYSTVWAYMTITILPKDGTECEYELTQYWITTFRKIYIFTAVVTVDK